MTQKGFIQIPLLIAIITLIIVASAGAGLVLHKQGKLASLTANISEVFKSTEETIPAEKTEVKPEKLEMEQGPIEANSCININCPSCQHCLSGSCVVRPDGYNDCGSGCQRCINGSCQDYNTACPNCQRCSPDTCVNYCQGTDTNCGCTSCTNCNALDKCSGNSYLDYYCSGASCIFNSDNCSDCSCSCGGYNIEESITNGNCDDGKDNDCDGKIDLAESQCIPPKEDKTLWEVEYHYKYPEENEEIISEGNVIVIYDKKVFDKEWVELQLKDTLNCIPILKDKFKIDLPAPAKTRLLILDRLTMDNEQPVSYATSPGIVNICTIEGYQSTIANIDYFRKKINEEKVCLNLHEMTHVFVAETPIPMWANEGLATYAEKEFDPSRAEVECRENGWYGPSYYGGDDIEQPYSDLSKPSGQNGEPGIYWYYTGYCFWIYIQERYGESTIPKILQELKKNENNYSLDFVKDIVNKVLNEDITEITKEKFGVPSE